MKRNDLRKSPVQFNEERHIYTLNGVTLSGITSIIARYVFPRMYDNVPTATLQAAAERGTRIHKDVENIVNAKREDLVGVVNESVKEAQNFYAATKKNKIKWLASEYLVDDGNLIASKIDLVDSEYNLYDIKTYGDFTTDKREYARWQLSMYKWLFEKCNSDKHVQHLTVVHLHEDVCEFVEVDPIPQKCIDDLVTTYAIGADCFDNPMTRVTSNDENETAFLTEFAEANRNAKLWSAKVEEMKAHILETMTNNGACKITKDGGWSFSRGRDTETTKFDEAAFKEAHPQTWSKYQKKSVTKGKFLVTFPK